MTAAVPEEPDYFAHAPGLDDDLDGRERAFTDDSECSTTDSRCGDYEIHDEHGKEIGEELNLRHPEVAYQFTDKKKTVAFVTAAPTKQISNSRIHTGGTLRLQELKDEIGLSRKKQDELLAQIEKQKAELQAKAVAVEKQERQLTALLQSKSVAAKRRPSATVSSRSAENEIGRPVVLQEVRKPMSDEGDVPISSVAREQVRKGQLIGQIGPIDLILPQLEEVQGFSSFKNIRKIIVGGDQDATEEDKVVLLFGSKEAGKTSVITSMLNYLYDVKKENLFRFTISREISPTLGLTEFVINNSILPFRVTVVDTPGILDEKGYTATSSVIRKWFEQELKAAGRFRMDAISLVLKNDEELGWPYIHELAEVKRMFGDDLKTNVLPIITHSEVLPQPLAVRALVYANVTFLEYYKVNNSGFIPSENTKNKLKQNLYFTHGSSSLERYFTDLHNLVHPLLAILHSTNPAAVSATVRRSD